MNRLATRAIRAPRSLREAYEDGFSDGLSEGYAYGYDDGRRDVNGEESQSAYNTGLMDGKMDHDELKGRIKDLEALLVSYGVAVYEPESDGDAEPLPRFRVTGGKHSGDMLEKRMEKDVENEEAELLPF